MGIIAWIVLGAIAGFIANLIMGSSEGVIGTIILGIVGGIVGGFVASALGIGTVTGLNPGSIAIAVVGAIIVVAIYRAFAGKRSGAAI